MTEISHEKKYENDNSHFRCKTFIDSQWVHVTNQCGSLTEAFGVTMPGSDLPSNGSKAIEAVGIVYRHAGPSALCFTDMEPLIFWLRDKKLQSMWVPLVFTYAVPVLGWLLQ